MSTSPERREPQGAPTPSDRIASSRGVRVVRVLAPNPDVFTLEGTNTYVVGSAPSGPSIVIDPGPDDPAHLDEVVRTAGRVEAIVVTHAHPDHEPGAAPLADRTGAPVYAFRPPEGGRPLRDGQTVQADGVTLTALHTPGHTVDHVCLVLDDGPSMFTGDAVLGRGTSVIDPPEGDLVAYLRSLRRMREIAPRTIYPGHGPVVTDGVAKLEEYLSHRAERERQVEEALADGAATIPELVDRIYAGYPDEVRPLAARSVLAHLDKLESEGRVARTGRGDDARYAPSEARSCSRCGRPVLGRAKLCSRCQLGILQEAPADQADPGPDPQS
jgi:glyoxylase-like metal-dependent hydrolase (beta-lactamase superfamily II)